jgi:hypothetical protein
MPLLNPRRELQERLQINRETIKVYRGCGMIDYDLDCDKPGPGRKNSATGICRSFSDGEKYL